MDDQATAYLDNGQSLLLHVCRLTAEMRSLEGQRAATVLQARHAGATWTQIGDMLGMSKQAAWERYTRATTSPLVETAQLTLGLD